MIDLAKLGGRAAQAAAIAIGLGLASPAATSADSYRAAVGAYAREDYAWSAARLRRLAERGDPRAQSYLGYMYATGRGVPQNYRGAVYWYRRAAYQGLPTAQYLLGLMYDKGHGVEQDFILAEAWLNLAVAHANPRERAAWVGIRDAVSGKMTHSQLEQSQRLALEWRPGEPLEEADRQ